MEVGAGRKFGPAAEPPLKGKPGAADEAIDGAEGPDGCPGRARRGGGQRVFERPGEAKHRCFEGVPEAVGVGHGEAGLMLPDRFVGPAEDVVGGRAVRLQGQLGLGEGPGVFGPRAFGEVVAAFDEPPTGHDPVDADADLRGQRPAPLPKAGRLVAADRQGAAPRSGGAGQLSRQPAGPEASRQRSEPGGDRLGRDRRTEGHDAPGRVPIQGGRGADQDFGSVDQPEIDVGELALAVGQCLGNAVEEDLDAADPEIAPGAGPPNRQSLIEGRVEPVGDVDAGQPA